MRLGSLRHHTGLRGNLLCPFGSVTLYGKCSFSVKKCGSIEQHVGPIPEIKSINILIENVSEPHIWVEIRSQVVILTV